MTELIRIAPPNSIIFISDINGGAAPDLKRGLRLWSSPSCIVVGCRAFMDGETEILLGKEIEPEKAEALAFEGVLETPNRTIIISTSERNVLLSCAVSGITTKVRIWVNKAVEPDRIAVSVA